LAVNCSVAPVAILAVVGETAIEVTVTAAAVTVSVVEPVTPLIDAVIVVLPAAAPVAMPISLTVATDGLEEVHVAEDERFAVDPSL
jgi:hypothetical protein